MTISAVDMFTVGIGPSSSHTVGPMRAAGQFMSTLDEWPARVVVNLRGSLAATGRGHGTDRAVILGLVGWTPTNTTPQVEPTFGSLIPTKGTVEGPAGRLDYRVNFDPTPAPEHPNTMTFTALREDKSPIVEDAEYFSVGGGFILDRAGIDAQRAQRGDLPSGAGTTGRDFSDVPHPFHNWAELAAICHDTSLSVEQIICANESALHGSSAIAPEHMDLVWRTMRACVDHGLHAEGTLPGGLDVRRRAPGIYRTLTNTTDPLHDGGLPALDWTNLYAMAVNEENAAGGTVVTAPTNGAAGIIPAVLHYSRDFLPSFTEEDARTFLFTAAAIGIIIKENASISGAEVGCQGEVGSASAMAAAGLAALLGGNCDQIGNAAEIALEHNLGLTCDPVGGLVQIPCIERNAVAAGKAINAARLALHGDGDNRVSLDNVIVTMAATGRDMLTKYKETSSGGLAQTLGFPVSFTEC